MIQQSKWKLLPVMYWAGAFIGTCIVFAVSSSSVLAFSNLTSVWTNPDQFSAAGAYNYLIDSNHGDSKNDYFSIFLPQSGDYGFRYDNDGCSDRVTDSNTNLHFYIDEQGLDNDTNIDDVSDRDVSLGTGAAICSNHDIAIPARPVGCENALINNKCRVNLRVQMTCTRSPDCNFSDGMIIKYTLRMLKGGVLDAGNTALIAPMKNRSGVDNGILFKKQASRYYGLADYDFGLPCNAAATPGVIKFGDTDPDLNGTPPGGGTNPVRARLQKTDINGVTTTINLNSADRPGTHEKSSGANLYYELDQNGSFKIPMKSGERYRIEFWNIFTQASGVASPGSNYVSISIPGDAIYGSDSYSGCWSARPDVGMQKQLANGTWQNIANNSAVSPDDVLRWTHTVTATAGDPPIVQYGYTSTNAGISEKTKWSTNLGVGASASSTSPNYQVPSAAATNTKICRSTVITPSSYNNNGETSSAGACVIVQRPNTLVCVENTFASVAGIATNTPYEFTLSASGAPTAPASIGVIITAPNGLPVAPITTVSFAINVLTATGTYRFTPTIAGTYTLSWKVTDNAGISSPCNAATIPAGDQPYFTVEGGDILGGFEQTTSIIASWNGGTANNYHGAGTTLAAIAGDKDINSFITNASVINTPSQLAFANTTANSLNAVYGGHFAATPEELDYISDAGAAAACPVLGSNPSFKLNGIASGVYQCNDGNVTIQKSVLAGGGKNVTIIAGGSVFISDDITYSYGSNADIPRLNVYAKGDIVVAAAVKEMHGVFVAQGGSKKFYSCGGSATTGYEYGALAAHNECSTNKLTVYGSVVAGQLILGRTSGSWTQAGSNAAETFVHSPETWLSKPLTSGTGATQTKFDSYISLPPVL